MSTQYLNDLYSQRASVIHEMRSMIIDADAVGRGFSRDDDARMRELDQRVDLINAEIKKLESAQRTLAGASALTSGLEAGRRAEYRGSMDLREQFLRTMDQGHIGAFYPVDTPLDLDLRALQSRALQSAGGSAIQTSYADFVTIYERTLTPMMNANVVNVVNVPDGSPRVFPRVTADPNHGGTTTAEAGGINELDATFSAVTLTPGKYAVMNLWSSELAQDAAIPLEATIAFTSARELSVDIGAALTTTLGTAAGNGGTAAGTGSTFGQFFGPTDLVNLYYSLAAPYRENGSWQANSTTLAQIRNARATTGEFLWQPAMSAGEPETILGRPVYENPALSNGSAAKSVYFGDFNRFVVARAPLRVETSIDYKFGTDQVALRTIERVAGDLVDAAAIKFLTNAAI